MSVDRLEVTADGWTVEDVGQFRFLTDYDVPRPWRVGLLLRADIRQPMVLRMWAIGFGFTAAAVATGWWTLLFAGVPPLLLYGYMFANAMDVLRRSRLDTAVIGPQRYHPILPKMFKVADGTLSGGQPVKVAFDRRFANAIDVGHAAEVVVLLDPESEYQSAIAVRSLPR